MGMEGMLWGVAAMVVKDAVNQQYLKGRDYERNVRQVYRDIDNLKITMAHVKVNCGDEDLDTGPHAPFIQRAERQLRDAYRTLKRDYPRKPGLSKLLDYASTPGAEMHLLDIGKEANQTARGLGDLLSEIRFAKIGKSKEEPPRDKMSAHPAALASPHTPLYDMTVYENALSEGSVSPQSMASDQASLFDHSIVRPSSIHSPSSSTSSQSRRRSSSLRSRRHSISEPKQKSLPPSTWPKSRPLEVILEGGRDREHALDNLQIGIDNVLEACDDEHEAEAMDYLERALAEVLRLQKTRGFAGSRADEDLGDAVEDLDDAMNSLVDAKNGKEKKYAMKRLSHALEDVDMALAERQKDKEREPEHRPRQITQSHASHKPPTTHGSVRRKQESRERSRRYSMY